ncbi:hypothetical protein [Corallococcus caeni]|uniref:Uncharacterized protein n=1 Tax=Corallococcus caeni TaxID=3082388 RepID=A0ABQ6QYG2_9BACT|nr:hypothetical protein ASNO1_53130 [Corallococcus sp. NO1]
MPVKPLPQSSSLTNPSAPTATFLKGMSGSAKSTKPLTESSYKILKDRLDKQAQQIKQNSPLPNGVPKLGFLVERARIPRAIGLKMADLTESYSQQMWALFEAAQSIEKEEEEPYGPELEGVLEKSRQTAERFQQAMDEIERCYAVLRDESLQVVHAAANAIIGMNTDVPTKLQLLEALFKKYNVDYRRLLDINTGAVSNFDSLVPKQVLLPLLKGKNVYRNKQKTLDYLMSFTTKTNSSKQLVTRKVTDDDTTIQMLYQVQPKFETSVFSDHAGFVASFSTNGCPPLFVYYHSLEHGNQHTTTRTAWNYGSQPGFHLPVFGTGGTSPEKSTLAIHDHRAAYLKNLPGELNALMTLASAQQGNVLVVVGECTLAIHEGILDLVLQVAQDPTDWTQIRRISESSVNVHGAKTQALNYDLKVVNAGKPKADGTDDSGLGVHALMGYLFLNTQNPSPGVSLEASLLSVGKDTRQNLLTVKYGPHGELHAFTHLLNKKENLLAKELKDCDYVSVGGDLNNITQGKALVETRDRNGTQLSMGSNSGADVMYDKIVIL